MPPQICPAILTRLNKFVINSNFGYKLGEQTNTQTTIEAQLNFKGKRKRMKTETKTNAETKRKGNGRQELMCKWYRSMTYFIMQDSVVHPETCHRLKTGCSFELYNTLGQKKKKKKKKKKWWRQLRSE